MKGTSKRLADEVAAIPLVDTHEHLIPEEARGTCAVDFTYLFGHYNSCDLLSAGIPPRLLEAVRLPINRYRDDWFRKSGSHRRVLEPERGEMSLAEKWEAVEPYWKAIRNTAYARWTLLMIREVFGIEDLSRDTYQELSIAIADSTREGWYREILWERAYIERSIVDISSADVDLDLMAPVFRVDAFVAPRSREDLDYLEKRTGVAIHTLENLVRALYSSAEDGRYVGFKSALAYERTLDYENPSRHDAETIFERLFTHRGEGLGWLEAKPMQDYLMHQAVRLSIELHRPFQIHTGLHAGGHNVISNSRPTLLTKLLIEYQEAIFDLFHGGYPYFHEWVALAKNFPNVYPDMCWMYIISPYVSANLLHELLDMVPASKILGFGGDSLTVEGAFAHALIAREVVSRVLSEKVEAGIYGEEQALNLARSILHDNPAHLYGLDS